MAEIKNLNEQLNLELEPEDLILVKNIINTKDPIESARPTNSTEIKDLIPEIEDGWLPIAATDSLSTIFLWPKYFYNPPLPLYLIEGTSGSDLLFDTPKDDFILAKGGNDYVIAWRGGSDLIYGEDGNDFIYAGDGNDRTYGGSGNDKIYGGSGNDKIYGDSSYYDLHFYVTTNDFLTTTNSDPFSLNSEAKDLSQPSSGDSSSLIYPYPYPYPDTPNGDDSMYGGAGDDYMEGGSGDDSMYGGSGDDSMYGDFNPYSFIFNPFALTKLSSGDSSSLIYPYPYPYPYPDTPSGDDRMYGGAGDDKMYGGGGNNRMYGGAGDDKMYGDSDHSQSFLYSDFYSYPRSGDDYMEGGIGRDYMEGGSGDDSIHGGSDNDRTYGGSGNDKIYGGSGDDYMEGGSGRDYLDGGSGNDTIIANERRWEGLISVGSNQDLILESSPVLANSSIEPITGVTENTSLTDIAVKPDLLKFEPIFFPGFPFRGGDEDRLTGGQGGDKFIFHSPDGGIDTITDFNVSQGDQIQVSRYGFEGELSYGQLEADQFTLGGTARDANDRFIYNAKTGDLFFDVDGVGGLEQVQFAQLSGSPSLTSSEIFVI